MKTKSRSKAIFFISSLFVLVLAFLPSCQTECTHKDLTKAYVLPTCTASGYTVFTCNGCSFSFEAEFTSPTEHTLTRTEVAPSCTEGGYTLSKCSECSYTEISKQTPPAAHTMKTIEVAATCEKEGYALHSCETCDFSYTSDHVSALSHTFEATLTEPTCTEAGYTTKTCSVCSHTITTDHKDPKGHSYTSEIIRATSSFDGYTLFTCSDCDHSYKDDYESRHEIFTGAYVDSSTPLALGVDVSFYNGELDWGVIADAGVDFAILRIGSSISGKDSCFDRNYTEARKAGIEIGAYYYVEATSTEEMLGYAEELKKLLDGKKFEYPIYLDIEKDSLGAELGRELITEMSVAFIEDLQADGYFAALYTNNNWLKNYYDKELVTGKYDIWYARYISTEKLDSPLWNLELYGAVMGMWQYTDEGVISGISHPFDLNIVYKDYPSIIKKYHYNGY